MAKRQPIEFDEPAPVRAQITLRADALEIDKLSDEQRAAFFVGLAKFVVAASIPDPSP